MKVRTQRARGIYGDHRRGAKGYKGNRLKGLGGKRKKEENKDEKDYRASRASILEEEDEESEEESEEESDGDVILHSKEEYDEIQSKIKEEKERQEIIDEGLEEVWNWENDDKHKEKEQERKKQEKEKEQFEREMKRLKYEARIRTPEYKKRKLRDLRLSHIKSLIDMHNYCVKHNISFVRGSVIGENTGTPFVYIGGPKTKRRAFMRYGNAANWTLYKQTVWKGAVFVWKREEKKVGSK